MASIVSNTCLCVINGLECMPVFWEGANLCFKIRQARNPGKCVAFVVHEKLYVARNMYCAHDHGKYVMLVFHDQYVNRVIQENVLCSCFTINCMFQGQVVVRMSHGQFVAHVFHD